MNGVKVLANYDPAPERIGLVPVARDGTGNEAHVKLSRGKIDGACRDPINHDVIVDMAFDVAVSFEVSDAVCGALLHGGEYLRKPPICQGEICY